MTSFKHACSTTLTKHVVDSLRRPPGSGPDPKSATSLKG